jgi:Family of unknown function (DUF6114)
MADTTANAGGTGPAPAEPGGAIARACQGHRRARLGPRAWRAFAAWRRGRPFWAGVFLIIAGAELLLIPLPVDAMGLILHIGTGGVLGILIGAVLIACALLLWFNPAQRVFYSIVAVLLAVAALIASNLGGFLVGTLLGVLGGSLGFGWTPLEPGAIRSRWWLRRRPAAQDAGSGGPAVLSGIGLPIVMAALAVLAPLSGQSHQGQPDGILPSPIPSLLPNPAPSPTSTPSPTPDRSAPPTAGPDPTASSPAASSSASPDPAASTGTPGPPASASASPRPRAGNDPSFAVAAVPSTMTAASAVITGFAYDGNVDVSTGQGTAQMMEFSASTITLSSVDLAAGRSGAVVTTTAPGLSLSGDVTLYATRLSGDLLGIPVTLTPGSPLGAILQAIAPLTKAVPVPMTNVVVDQPYTAAGGMSASGLQVS